jgi:hypothetical protein
LLECFFRFLVFCPLAKYTGTGSWVTSGSSSFTTTHWVIHWVHGYTSNSWALTSPSLGTGFTQYLQAVIRVRSSTYGSTYNVIKYSSTSLEGNLIMAYFTFSPHQDTVGTCTSGHGSSLSRVHFDRVNGCPSGIFLSNNALPILGAASGPDFCSHLQFIRSNDIALFAICILQKSDKSSAVRIVFDRLDRCWNIPSLFLLKSTIR